MMKLILEYMMICRMVEKTFQTDSLNTLSFCVVRWMFSVFVYALPVGEFIHKTTRLFLLLEKRLQKISGFILNSNGVI